VFVYIDAPFVEVKIPVERLTGDRYELDRLGMRLVGAKTKRTFALGDAITVRIEEVSIERREIVGLPAAQAETPDGTKQRRVGSAEPSGSQRRTSRAPSRGEKPPVRKKKRTGER